MRFKIYAFPLFTFNYMTHPAGKLLIIIGAILILTGLLLNLTPKIPWLGKLPGDICVKKENFVFYFPLATSLLLSALLSLILWLFKK